MEKRYGQNFKKGSSHPSMSGRFLRVLEKPLEQIWVLLNRSGFLRYHQVVPFSEKLMLADVTLMYCTTSKRGTNRSTFVKLRGRVKNFDFYSC